MSLFKQVELSSIANIIDCPHSTPKWTDEGIFAIRNYNLSNGRIIKDKASYVDEKTYTERVRRAKPKKGDCVISREAPIGSVGYITTNENICLGQRVVLIQAKNNNEGRYLLYQLLSSNVQNQFKQSDGTGSTVSNLRIPYIEKVLVYYTDADSQKLIGQVIANYDELVDVNEKRMKILREMTQRLYTEWFVKFKFPGHEKTKMVDSGTDYGKIPEGWRVVKLEEVSRIIRGCSYSTEEIDDFSGEYYLVNLKSFNRGGGFRFDGEKYFSGSINSNQSLKTGDVVVAVTDMTTDRAVIARPARIPEINGKITFSADVVKINSDILPNSFIYQLLSSYRFTETTKQMANGANVLHLKPSAILEFVTVIPDTQSLNRFDVLCEPIAREIDKLLKQNDNLSKTRDLLIPQLITGRRVLR